MNEQERLEVLNAPLSRTVKAEVREISFKVDKEKIDIKLSLTVNWGVGVGGGLWAAGMLLCRQMSSRPKVFRQLMNGKRVLELGAGTGLIGLTAAQVCHPREVVLTDLESHVDLLMSNAVVNPVPDCIFRIAACDWARQQDLGGPFDVILGGDLAYNPGLYAPLISCLMHYSDTHTVIVLGVTKSDTDQRFFAMLDAAGFEFYRIPDWELEGKCEAGALSNFGIFVIFKRR